MDKIDVLNTVKKYLSKQLNCTEDDFQKDGIIFVDNDNRDYPFLEICTMGKAVIVSTSKTLLPKVQTLLNGKSRDEIFECPFIYGQSIYYIPDFKLLKSLPLNNKYNYELLQGKEIQKLKGLTGFDNSLVFDQNGNTSTSIVFYAMKGSEIVALASASNESEELWELGVDVKPEYRKYGLATVLINNLALSILEQGIVPFYCASTTNIGSQAVAHRSGFIPCWVSTYRNILDGSSSYDNLINSLSL